MTDIIRWTLVGILVVMGISANYVYVEQFPLYARATVILLMFATATFFAVGTTQGQQFRAFALSARTEARKVVWPSRQETIQASIIVIIMVFIMSLILWGFDTALFKLMAWFTGRGV